VNPSPTYTGFEWDPEKSDQCKRERGFDFAYAARIFNARLLLEIASNRSDERRFMTIGPIEDRIFVVVWAPREPNRRIISARIASRKECNIYRALL
jgi:hypothetical protein